MFLTGSSERKREKKKVFFFPLLLEYQYLESL